MQRLLSKSKFISCVPL